MSQTISNNLSVANSISSNNITSSNANIQNISVDNLTINSSLNTNNINLNCNNITSSGTISAISLSVPTLNLTSLSLNNVDLNTRIIAIENKNSSQDTNINTLNSNVFSNTSSINTLNTNVNNNTNSINNLQTNTTGITYSSGLQTSTINTLQVTNTLTQSSIIEDSFIINSSNYNQVFYNFPIYRNYILMDNQSITLRFPVAPSFAIGQIIKIKRINYNGVKDNIGIYQAQNGTNITIDSRMLSYLYGSSYTSSLISNIDCMNYDISILIYSTTEYKLIVNNILTDMYITNINSNASNDQINILDVTNFNDLINIKKALCNNYMNVTNNTLTIDSNNIYSVYYLKNSSTIACTITLTDLGSNYDGLTITIRMLGGSGKSFRINAGSNVVIRRKDNSEGNIDEGSVNTCVLMFVNSDKKWYELQRV